MDASDTDALIRMVASEGGSEPPEAQQAIASTAINRSNLTGEPVGKIASNPSVYTGAGTSRFNIDPDNPAYQTVAANITPVLKNGPTTDATHFYAPKLLPKPPDWAQGPGQKIGSQLFYSRPQDFAGDDTNDMQAAKDAYFGGSAAPNPPPVQSAVLPSIPGATESGFQGGDQADMQAAKDAYFREGGPTVAGGGPASTTDDLISQFASHGINSALGTAQTVASIFNPAMVSVAPIEAALASRLPGGAAAQAWLAQQPHSDPERMAALVGEFAPGALIGPGDVGALAGLASRAANVALPAAGAFEAQNFARAFNAPQSAVDLAGIVGGGLGGLAAGARLAPKLIGEAGIDATAPIAAGKAARATNYVQGLLGSPNPDMVAAQQAGLPVTLADLAAPRGPLAARANALRSPAMAAETSALAAERRENFPSDVANAFADATGIRPETVNGDFQAQIDAQRAALGPRYETAFASTEPVTSDALTRLMKLPAVQTAMSRAKTTLLNSESPSAATLEAPKAIPQAPTPPISVNGSQIPMTPAIRQQLGLPEAGASTAPVPAPNLEAWDMTKRALQDAASYQDTVEKGLAAPDTGFGGSSASALRSVATKVTGALREANPDYADILDKGGDYLGMQSAFKRGQGDLFNAKVQPDLQAKYLGTLSDAEKSAYAAGQANAVNSQINNARLTAQRLATPAISAKLAAGMGSDASQAFIDRVGQLTQLKANAARMNITNETSTEPTRVLGAQQDQAAGGGISGALSHVGADLFTGAMIGGKAGGVKGALLGAPAYALGRAGLRASTTLADRIQSLGVSQETKDEIGRLLMSRMPLEDFQNYAAGFPARTGLAPLAARGAFAGYLGAPPPNQGAFSNVR